MLKANRKVRHATFVRTMQMPQRQQLKPWAYFAAPGPLMKMECPFPPSCQLQSFDPSCPFAFNVDVDWEICWYFLFGSMELQLISLQQIETQLTELTPKWGSIYKYVCCKRLRLSNRYLVAQCSLISLIRLRPHSRRQYCWCAPKHLSAIICSPCLSLISWKDTLPFHMLHAHTSTRVCVCVWRRANTIT